MKKFRLAEGAFVKLVRSEKNKPHDWLHLALVQQGQNNLSAASENLLKAGEIGLSRGDYQTTYKSLNKLKLLSPKSSKAHKNYLELGLKVSTFLEIKNKEM